MTKFQKMVDARVLWLAKFRVFGGFFRWVAKDPERNVMKFIIFFNSANTLVYLTAAISPWIFLLWVTLIPWAFFRSTPIAATSYVVSEVRKGKMSLDAYVLTVFFMMIHYICVFACLYMIVGLVVDGSGKSISGIWAHFYFSTVTFTTLGFGNLVPANFGAEVVAAVEALVGFAAFAYLIGVASGVSLRPSSEDDA